jgi:hypothetical protein
MLLGIKNVKFLSTCPVGKAVFVKGNHIKGVPTKLIVEHLTKMQ